MCVCVWLCLFWLGVCVIVENVEGVNVSINYERSRENRKFYYFLGDRFRIFLLLHTHTASYASDVLVIPLAETGVCIYAFFLLLLFFFFFCFIFLYFLHIWVWRWHLLRMVWVTREECCSLYIEIFYVHTIQHILDERWNVISLKRSWKYWRKNK